MPTRPARQPLTVMPRSGLPSNDPGGDGGGEHRRDGGGVGGHQDVQHVRRGLEAHGGAGVEAEPAQPEDEQADHRQGHAVAGDRLGPAVPAVLADPGPQDDGARQRGPAAQGVDGGIPGKVQKAQAGQPAAAPDPVAHDGVDHQRQDKGKEDKGDILHTLGHSARDDGGGGAAEHQLEKELAPEGDGRGQGVVIKGQVRLSQDEQVLRARRPARRPPNISPQPSSRKPRDETAKTMKFLDRMLTVFFARAKPASTAGEAQVHKEHQDGRQEYPQGVDHRKCHVVSSLRTAAARPAAHVPPARAGKRRRPRFRERDTPPCVYQTRRRGNDPSAPLPDGRSIAYFVRSVNPAPHFL